MFKKIKRKIAENMLKSMSLEEILIIKKKDSMVSLKTNIEKSLLNGGLSSKEIKSTNWYD